MAYGLHLFKALRIPNTIALFLLFLDLYETKCFTMIHLAKSIRPFIGSKDFEISKRFYKDLGFEEHVISNNLSVFHSGTLSFYLQDAYVKDWLDNTMVFMEVVDVQSYWDNLLLLDLPSKYKDVRQIPIRHLDWGSECFLHDPSGILWHFGEFKEK